MERILPRRVNVIAAGGGAMMLALLGALALAPSAGAQAGGFVGDGDDDLYGEAVCIVDGAAGTAASPVDSFVHDSRDDDEAWDGVPGDPSGDGPNMMDTDGGTFDFMSTTVACAGMDEGGEVIGALEADDLVIEAGTASDIGEAEYTNLVCGTGHAEGTADLFGVAGGDSPGTDLLTRFGIDFVGGKGPLAVNSFDGVLDLTDANSVIPEVVPSDPDDPDGIDNLQDVDTGWGSVGAVNITPSASMVEPGADPDGNPDPSPAPPRPTPSNTDMGDDGTLPPVHCVTRSVTGFMVDAAFAVTLSGDTDVANNENDDPVG